MKRLITAIVLLLLIAGASVTSYSYTKHTTELLTESVAHARVFAQKDDLNAARSTLQSSYLTWRQRSNVLGALLRHNELDEAERLYQHALQALDNEDAADMLVQTRELQGMLRRLSEMEELHYKNLF